MNIQDYAVPAISAGVYLVLLMVKPLIKEGWRKYLPLIAGLLGVGLNAWLNAGFSFLIFLEGLASGLGATGIDQLIKETTGYYDKEEE